MQLFWLAIVGCMGLSQVAYSWEPVIDEVLEEAMAIFQNPPVRYRLELLGLDSSYRMKMNLVGDVFFQSDQQLRVEGQGIDKILDEVELTNVRFVVNGDVLWMEEKKAKEAIKVEKLRLSDDSGGAFYLVKLFDISDLVESLKAIAWSEDHGDKNLIMRTGIMTADFLESNLPFGANPDFMGKTIEIRYHRQKGFPLSLKFEGRDKDWTIITVSHVKSITPEGMAELLDYTPPEGVEVRDVTEESKDK